MTSTLTRPTRTTLPDLEQGSPQWHDQRRGIVTASTVGNLITIGKLTAIDYAVIDAFTSLDREKVQQDFCLAGEK